MKVLRRQSDGLYWIDPETAEELRREQRVVDSAVGTDLVVVLDEDERRVLEQLFDLRSAREELIEAEMRQEYFAAPEFSDTLARERVVDRLVDDDAGRRIEVTLVDATWPGCEIFLVYADRLLGTREFRPDFGRFRVIVRSEHLEPDPTWSDASSTPRLEHILGEVRSLTRRLLHQWWTTRRTAGDVPRDPFGQTLYFGVAIERLVERGEDRSEPSLPVVALVDGRIERRLASWKELADSADSLGVLPFVRGQRPERQLLSGLPTGALEVGHGVDDDILQHLFPATRLRDVTRTVGIERQDRKDAFQEQLQYPTSLLGALVEGEVEHGGLNARIGYYAGGSPGTVDVAVLLDRRLLTTVSVVVPFGRFRAVVSGDAVQPMETLDGMASGHDEVEEAVRRAATGSLRLLCRRFQERDDMTLAALHDDALQLVGWVRDPDAEVPADLLTAIETMEVFRTTEGRRLDLRGVSELGDDGVMPISAGAPQREALYVPEEQRDLVQAALPEWSLRAVHGEPLEATAAEEESDREDDRPHWILVEAAEILARVSRSLPERARRSFTIDLGWSDRPLDGAFCGIRGRRAMIDPDHPAMAAFAGAGPLGARLAASLVLTELNRSRKSATDVQELTMHRAILKHRADR